MGRFLRLVMALLLCWLWGCSSPSPPPASMSYLDLAAKQTHIRNTLATLETFHRTARDLRTRPAPEAQQELRTETRRYVELQVRPVITDFEANHSVKTQLDLAQLELLCGLVYLELQDYSGALATFDNLKKRYGDRTELLTATLDRRFVDFDHLGAGMDYLDQRLSLEY